MFLVARSTGPYAPSLPLSVGFIRFPYVALYTQRELCLIASVRRAESHFSVEPLPPIWEEGNVAEYMLVLATVVHSPLYESNLTSFVRSFICVYIIIQ